MRGCTFLCTPFGTSCTVGPCEVRKGCGKRSLTVRCFALHCFARLSSRDVAAPVVAASYPVATARKQTLLFSGLPCSAVRSPPIPSLPCGPGRANGCPLTLRENKLCAALRCSALSSSPVPSAHAANLCSHFFRLACFKPCQVVASELGAVVAKPFKHGRMHKRILYIRHVQYFRNNRH